MARLRDPRLWLGLAVTAAALVFALRDVDLAGVAAEFRRANLWLLWLPSVPAYVAVVVLRGLRWRHLTNAIRPLPRSALCRATALGFLANNVLPLRIGELLRALALARECGVPAGAVVGTVVVERVIDSWMVLALALVALSLSGDTSGSWQRGIVWLLPLAALPVIALAWLRLAPDRVRRVAGFTLRPFPERLQRFALRQLDLVGEGLGSLTRGTHLVWIALHSLAIWLVASTVPVLAGFWSFGLAFPSRFDELLAGWITLAAIAVAVALPSAPGFFGVYHSACRLVLESFGFTAETAVATGTLIHAVFWLTTSALGLLALRGMSLGLASLRGRDSGTAPRASGSSASAPSDPSAPGRSGSSAP